MKDESKSLPCPFCGGEPEIIRRGTNRVSNIIDCSECGCRVETGVVGNPFLDWNTRTDTELQAHNRALVEALEARKEGCPNCDNVGWYADPSHHTGEPEQIQCEFCYTNPVSVFNIKQLLTQQPNTAIYKAEQEVVEAAIKYDKTGYGVEGMEMHIAVANLNQVKER